MPEMTVTVEPLRIAQVAPPLERVPPAGYGGTERVVDELCRELVRRGHEVVLLASGDSMSPGELVATVPRHLRNGDGHVDPTPAFVRTLQAALRQDGRVDVIHSHLDFWSLGLARAARTPVVSTFHGRLDLPLAGEVLRDAPGPLTALSRAHAALAPSARWAAIVYNGLSLDRMPFRAVPTDDLCFVGRVAPEKGIVDAIRAAALSGRKLRMATKIPYLAEERQYYDEVVRPELRKADVEELGELSSHDRDALVAESYAMLMPSNWPEPFGLTAIESLGCGTPVIARPCGALPEIIRDGIDGYFGGDAAAMAARLPEVAGLDRAAIRASVIDRFSASRMADGYEALYARLLPKKKATRVGGARVA